MNCNNCLDLSTGNLQKLLAIVLIIAFCNQNLKGQVKDQKNLEEVMPSMFLTQSDIKTKFRSSIGLSMVQPPKDLIEMAFQAPLFNYRLIYQLPGSFSIEGNINTIFVSNQISLGPKYEITKKDGGIRIGWDIAFIAGRMKHLGFDNSTHGWLHYPNISGSYHWNSMILTLKAEAVVVSFIKTKTGENEVSSSSNFYNGFTGGFYLEQRLHKNNVLIFGLKDSYVKYYWPTWLAFSTFNRFYHIPELSVCWILR